MTDDEIRAAIETALQLLSAEKPALDFAAVHERSTAHRLAVQMEPLFAGWNVDCEYDRDGRVLKELDGVRECDPQRATDHILPDIVVHHRIHHGREHNLLVIEMKKNAVRDQCDWTKLQLLTRPDGRYAYQLGLYINVADGRFVQTWFRDGHQVA